MIAILRTLVLSLVASVLLCQLAHAELFSFTIRFNSGPLAGNEYTGIFATAGPAPNYFVPEGSPLFEGISDTLLSFSITVEGINFHMSEEEYFPELPRIGMADDDDVTLFDYVGYSDGKKLSIFLQGFETNAVYFGDIGELGDNVGDLIDVHAFSMPDSPDKKFVPIPPPSGSGRFSGLTIEQARQQFDTLHRDYGFRRPRNRTSPLTSCGDWEWAVIDRSGVHWFPGCFCGSADASMTRMVFDFDAGRFRRLREVQFDERRR